METSDIKNLAISFVAVLILIVFMVLAPIYVMSDFSSERHWRWNAPFRQVPNVYSKLTPNDIKAFEDDPFRRQILEVMKTQPGSVPFVPVYLGPLGGPGFNVLGYLTVLSVLAWLSFAGYKVYKWIMKVRKEREENQY